MNCKPNDVAVVVTTCGWELCSNLLGSIVRVQRPVSNLDDEQSWTYEGRRLRNKRGEEAECLPDAWLRPLRNPGDDAVDEVSLVRRKPEEETA